MAPFAKPDEAPRIAFSCVGWNMMKIFRAWSPEDAGHAAARNAAGATAGPVHGRRFLAAVAAGFVLAVTLPGPARAQATLAGSSPKAGETVAPGMNVVALDFGNLADDGSGRVSVTGPVKVLTGRAVVAGGGTLCAAVAPLTNGAYTVFYNATSTAGDPISGRFSFKVADNGRATGIPKPCDEVDLPTAFPVTGGYAAIQFRHDPPAAVIAGLAALAAAVFAAWYLLRTRSSPSDGPES